MIIHFSLVGLRLDDAWDFRNFKVVLESMTEIRPAIEGIRFVDDDNVLVEISVVPVLPGAPADADWKQGYGKMVETATKYGWIDVEANAIRAHVERAQIDQV